MVFIVISDPPISSISTVYKVIARKVAYLQYQNTILRIRYIDLLSFNTRKIFTVYTEEAFQKWGG